MPSPYAHVPAIPPDIETGNKEEEESQNTTVEMVQIQHAGVDPPIDSVSTFVNTIPTPTDALGNMMQAVVIGEILPNVVDVTAFVPMFTIAINRIQQYLWTFQYEAFPPDRTIDHSPEGLERAIRYLMENVRLQLRLKHAKDHLKKQKYWYMVLAFLTILFCWLYWRTQELEATGDLAKARCRDKYFNCTVDLYKMNNSLTNCASKFDELQLLSHKKIQYQNDNFDKLKSEADGIIQTQNDNFDKLKSEADGIITTQNKIINAQIKEINDIKEMNAISIAKLEKQLNSTLSTGETKVIMQKNGECKEQLDKSECDITNCAYRTSQSQSCRPSNPMNSSWFPKGCVQWNDGSFYFNFDKSPSNKHNLCTDKAVCICAKLEEKNTKNLRVESEIIKKVIERCGKNTIKTKDECDKVIKQMNNKNKKNGIAPYTIFPEDSKEVHEWFNPAGCYLYSNQQFYFNTAFDDQSTPHSECSARNVCMCLGTVSKPLETVEPKTPSPAPHAIRLLNGGTRKKRKLRKTKKKQKKKPKKKPNKKSKRKPKKIKNLTKRDNYKKWNKGG